MTRKYHNAISGIYEIRSKIHPEKCYIGSSVNVHKRLGEHKRVLSLGGHDNPKLQAHYNKYNWDGFGCSVIEECDKGNLIEREQYYIDIINPWFNICKTAGNCFGKKHSDETKEKLKRARGDGARGKGWRHSEETKRLYSEQRKGRRLSKETIEKIVSKTRGQKRSDEFRQHLSEMKSGDKNYAYGKPARNRGSHHSDESKKKMSDSQKRAWERRRQNGTDKADCVRKRKKMSDETKRKISQMHKGKRMSPDTEFKKGHAPFKKKENE